MLKEAAILGLYEPSVYDPREGTVTVPLGNAYYQLVHDVSAALNLDEASVLRTFLEQAIEGASNHFRPEVSKAIGQEYLKDGSEPYVLYWARQKRGEIEAGKKGEA